MDGRPVLAITTSTGRSIARATQSRGLGGGEPVHAAPFGEQVGDEDDRTAHVGQRFLDAAHEQGRHQAGEEAAGADDHRVELANGLRHDRMDRWLRLEPETAHLIAVLLPRIHLDLAARLRAVAVLGADRGRLHAHGPHTPAAAEQTAQSVHRREEVAAVLLHHRQQQIAAGVPGEPIVLLERGQPGEQHAPRLAFVARQRQRALQHVARRQHAQLVTQLSRAAAAVEHRDDRIDAQPGVALQSAKQAGQTGAAAETADVEIPQLHHGIVRCPRTAVTRRKT